MAALQRDPLEFDIKLTADGVPVVIHDPTLDRTTNCSGRVVDKTLSQLRRCKADVLGVPGSGLPTRHVVDPSVGVPTLADVLALARRTGSTIVPEIKNYPTDSDYDPTPAFAAKATAGIGAGGIPLDRVIVQSFTTENLDVVQSQLPGAQTSLLGCRPATPPPSRSRSRATTPGSRRSGRSTRPTWALPTRAGAVSCPTRSTPPTR